MKTLTSRNPATQQVLKTFESLGTRELEERLERARAAFLQWRGTSFEERAARMRRAAEALLSRRDELARLMALEMGKPVAGGRAEIEKCAKTCDYYVENAVHFLSTDRIISDARESYVTYEPLGVVLAVMPWNFPFWQVFRFAAPTLMAGNVALLKHASNVPQCSLAIEEIFDRAGFPPGVFQSLLIGSEPVAGLIRDPRVAAVTLTGSTEAGAKVAAAAGAAIKKTVLELGGSDPFIVLPSADLERAAEMAAQARTINSGQSCIAAKRFIVHEAIAERFERAFVDRMRALRVGDPLDESTQVGPLATSDIVAELDRQVSESVRAGARALTGGKRGDGPGNFYEPTVLSRIPKGSPAYEQELFGPVASLFVAKSLAEAIALANSSRYGLGASVWTQDPAEREQAARELESGCVFFNGMVASDPRLPFGGVKESGYGRELSSHGIREFTNIKTICVLS